MSRSRQHCVQAVASSLAFALFFAVVLPAQTFIGNADAFDYGLSALVPGMALGFAALFIGSLLIAFLTEPICGCLFPLVFLLLAICGYLEVGVLSIGLPQIDGTLDQFHKPTIRKYLDLLVFAGLGSLAIALYRKLFNCIGWISLGFLILAMASVFDAPEPVRNAFAPTPFDDGFCEWSHDVYKSAVWSPKRNILFLVLDATPCDVTADEIAGDPRLRDQFTGFTAYRNNIGMHEKTIRGVPALMTGEYLTKDVSPADWLDTFWSPKSWMMDCREANYAMFVCAGLEKPYTNRRTCRSPKADLPRRSPFFTYTKSDPYVTLWDVLLFRLVPYRFKLDQILPAMQAGNRLHFTGKSLHGEKGAYEVLAAAPVVADEESTLHFYHTGGVHTPIVRGRRGEILGPHVDTLATLRDCAYDCMNNVATLLRALKAKGVYDRTLIVVTTDHGCVEETLVKTPISALLMVKPIAATNAFAVSGAPTSHCKISELMHKSVNVDLSADEVTRILTTRDRRLRIKRDSPEKWWYFGRRFDTYDIFYDDRAAETNRVNLGVFKTI